MNLREKTELNLAEVFVLLVFCSCFIIIYSFIYFLGCKKTEKTFAVLCFFFSLSMTALEMFNLLSNSAACEGHRSDYCVLMVKDFHCVTAVYINFILKDLKTSKQLYNLSLKNPVLSLRRLAHFSALIYI